MNEKEKEQGKAGKRKEGKGGREYPPPRIFVFMALRRSKNLNNSYTSRGAL